jgi:hypothetical protein
MMRRQVFRPSRQNGEGDPRLLVEQVRDGAVTPHGHQAAATRVAGGSAHERRSILRGPGNLLAQAHSPQRSDQPLETTEVELEDFAGKVDILEGMAARK